MMAHLTALKQDVLPLSLDILAFVTPLVHWILITYNFVAALAWLNYIGQGELSIEDIVIDRKVAPI